MKPSINHETFTHRRAAAGVAGAALALGALLGSGCSSSAKQTGPPAMPPVPVSMAVVEKRDVPIELRTIGNVEGYSSVSVRAQVGGTLGRVHFSRGENVRKGQLLFTIDPRPYQAALDGAKAQLGRDRAVAENAEANVARYLELQRKNKDYVTQAVIDEVRSTAASARETVKADEAAVETANLNLGYCSITAPISGRAGDLLVTEGNVVKANDQPLVVILQTRPIYVTFSVPQQFLPEIRRRAASSKLEVSAANPASGSGRRTGQLTFVDNAVNTQTGTIQLKATFPNDDESLWPGQFADVTLRLGIEEGALVVPTEAVQTGQQGSFIFVVKPDKTVESRMVTVSRTFDGRAIVEKGVADGETVVTDGQLRLVAGARVEAKTAEPAAGPSTGGASGAAAGESGGAQGGGKEAAKTGGRS